MYTILSHTWTDNEVTFDDIGKPHAPLMKGYTKIFGCCKLALRDGFDWAWIDTCCIDKRSSAELSEAINSMYKWYWQAAFCYAYLSDVTLDQGRRQKVPWREQLENSRWFKRGWTLQELLSPDTVEFYDEAWKSLGTKSSLIAIVKRATRIDRKFILDRGKIRSATIGTKLSWAALRQTTRSEDTAYCLLGLVGVNMPMLYGEGHRAFYRLQLEIIRQTNDHTIFAWEPYDLDWQRTAALAASPRCFAQSSHFERITLEGSADATDYQATNSGLSIALLTIPLDERRCVALLNCQNKEGDIACIWLEHLGNNMYHRLAASKLTFTSREEQADATLVRMYLVIGDSLKDERRLPVQLSVASISAPVGLGCEIVKFMQWSQGHDMMERAKFFEGRSTKKNYQNLLESRFELDRQSTVGGNSSDGTVNPVIWVFLYYSRMPVEMFIGLREDKVIFHAHKAPSRAAELRDNPWLRAREHIKSGNFDMTGDYQRQTINHHEKIIIEAWAKKTSREGRLCWTLNIKLFDCIKCRLLAECSCDGHSELKELN